MRAAQTARKAGYTGPLTLIGGEEHLPYDRPPLSKAYLDDEEPTHPGFPAAADLASELDIDVRTSTWATSLDSRRSSV